MSNLETGATYLQRSRYTETEIFDPSTNTLQVTITGRIWIGFFPGDLGPSGVVQWPGAALAFSGTVELTVDADTFAYTAFSYTGAYIDLCAELSD
jgi:hypothetical protein